MRYYRLLIFAIHKLKLAHKCPGGSNAVLCEVRLPVNAQQLLPPHSARWLESCDRGKVMLLSLQCQTCFELVVVFRYCSSCFLIRNYRSFNFIIIILVYGGYLVNPTA